MDVPAEPREVSVGADAGIETRRASLVPGDEASSDMPPLSRGMQVSYGFGSIAFGIGGVPLSSSLLMLYFNQVIGVEAVLVGVAIMVSVGVDAFTDPLIGWVSDRLRSPFGRRHMLMYISALPAALGFFLMWHAPAGLSSGALLAFMIAMLVLVNISISLYEVPSLALAPELAPDYTLRTKLLAYRWFFLMVGATATSVILYQVFLRQDEWNPLGVLNRARYEQFGLACAFVIFAAILISTAATHSRIRYLYVPPRRPIRLNTELAQLKTALTHKPLLALMFGGLMMGFGAGTTAGLVTYFNLHFWGLLPQQMAYLIAIAPVASLMALWLGPRLADRFGKKRAIIGLYALWLLTATVPISLRLLGVMPANGSALLLPILVGNITMAYTLAISCHIILGSAIADTVDDIAVKANVRSEGLMFSTYQVLDKVANGGGAFVAGAILSLVAFPTQAVAGTVPQGILDELALIQVTIVVLFNLASIAFFTRYNLTREDHERNTAILAHRRAHQQ